MKIWKAVRQWAIQYFGFAIAAWIAYRKGKKKAYENYNETVEKNKTTKQKIKENLKNSPKYKEFFENKKLLIIIFPLLFSCSTTPDWNENYCTLYEPVVYNEDEIDNILTEYQIDLNNAVYLEVCKENPNEEIINTTPTTSTD